MPMQQQPEADQLKAQAAFQGSITTFSTTQVSEFNAKTAKLASFRQTAMDPGPAALPELASFRQIHARREPSPPGREHRATLPS